MKTFNLQQRKPQVLLIGNGILRSEGNKEWKEFLKAIAVASKKTEEYEEIPYTIQASAISSIKDTERQNKYKEALEDYIYTKNTLIDNVLKIPFDAILTTNYTYELEYHLKSEYPKFTENTKRNYSVSNKREGNSLIYTYNNIGTQDIWHIHGEERRKSSIVLTHDEYARQTKKIVEYLSERGNEYQKFENDIHFKSWIDFFVLGDLYILGQGFNFSEFDLWWLLSRRLREKANIGKVYFYEPFQKENKETAKSQHLKKLALEAFGVEFVDCECEINNAETDFPIFYKKAIAKIASKVNTNLKEI